MAPVLSWHRRVGVIEPIMQPWGMVANHFNLLIQLLKFLLDLKILDGMGFQSLGRSSAWSQIMLWLGLWDHHLLSPRLLGWPWQVGLFSGFLEETCDCSGGGGTIYGAGLGYGDIGDNVGASWAMSCNATGGDTGIGCTIRSGMGIAWIAWIVVVKF